MEEHTNLSCKCTKPSQPDVSIKSTGRHYTWMDKNGDMDSRELTDYECKLEEEVQKLQDALFSLSSHYAKIQFRLRQISNASGTERDCLLRELDRVVYQDIDENRENYELPSLLEDSKILGNVRTRQNLIISQLRSRLMDLSEVANMCFCAESEDSYNNRKYVKESTNDVSSETVGQHDKDCCCIVCKETKTLASARGYLSQTWHEPEVEEENEKVHKKKKSKSKKKDKKRHGRRDRKQKYSNEKFLGRIVPYNCNPWYLSAYPQSNDMKSIHLLKNCQCSQKLPYSSSKRNINTNSDVSSVTTQDSIMKTSNSNYSRSVHSLKKNNEMNVKSNRRLSERNSIKNQKSNTQSLVNSNYSMQKVRESASDFPIQRPYLKDRKSSKTYAANQEQNINLDKDSSRNRVTTFKQKVRDTVSDFPLQRPCLKYSKSSKIYAANQEQNINLYKDCNRNRACTSKRNVRKSVSEWSTQPTNVNEKMSSKTEKDYIQNEASILSAPKVQSCISFMFSNTKKNDICKEKKCEATCKISGHCVDPRNNEKSKQEKPKKTRSENSDCAVVHPESSKKSGGNKGRRTSWATQSLLETKCSCAGKSLEKRTSYERQIYHGLCSRVRKIFDSQKLDQTGTNINEKQKTETKDCKKSKNDVPKCDC